MFSLSPHRMDTDQRINRSLNIAKLFFQNKDYNSAKNYINELLVIKPDSSDAYKLLSQINEALGQNDLALQNYRKSLELKSTSSMNCFDQININNNSTIVNEQLTPKMKTLMMNNNNNSSPKIKNYNSNLNTTTSSPSPLPSQQQQSIIDMNILKTTIDNLLETKFTTFTHQINDMMNFFASNISSINSNNNFNNESNELLKKQLNEMNEKLSIIINNNQNCNNNCNKLMDKCQQLQQQNFNKILIELNKINQIIVKNQQSDSTIINQQQLQNKINEMNQKFDELMDKIENIYRHNDDDDDDDDDDYNYDDDDDNENVDNENYGNHSYDDHHQQQNNNNQIPLNELFLKNKQQTNQWICDTCSVSNDDNVMKCVSCESLRYNNNKDVGDGQQQKNLFQPTSIVPCTMFMSSPSQQQQSSPSTLFGNHNSTGIKFGSFNFPDFKNETNNDKNESISNNQQNVFGFNITSSSSSITTPASATSIFSSQPAPAATTVATSSMFSSLTTPATTSKSMFSSQPPPTATTSTSMFSKPSEFGSVSFGNFSFPNFSNDSKNFDSKIETKNDVNSKNDSIEESTTTTSTVTSTSNKSLFTFSSSNLSTISSSPFQFGGNGNNVFPTFGQPTFGQPTFGQSPSQQQSTATNSNSGLFSFSNVLNLGQSNQQGDQNNQSNQENKIAFTQPKLNISNNQDEKEQSFDNTDNTELIIPKCNLPENYEHLTGEEDEQEIYCIKRAKLYVFQADEYKERGTGELKILKHKLTKKLRMVMRRDQVHTVCLNTLLNNETMKLIEKPKYLLIQCIDFSDDNKPDPQTFLLKTKEMKELVKFINDQLSGGTVNVTNGDVINDTTEDEDVKIIFVREPNEKYLPMINELKLPKNFYKFEEDEKSSCKGCIGCRVDELDWNQLTCSTVDDDKQQEVKNLNNQDQNNQSLNDFFSTLTANIEQTNKIDTIQVSLLNNSDSGNNCNNENSFISEKSKLLPENYKHITGEEDEETVYKERAKLYRFVQETNEFKERGVGEMKILKKFDKDDYRLLMRRDNVYKLICNQKILPKLKFTERSANSLLWCCRDFSENVNGDDQIFVIKFKDQNKRDAFKQAVENCMMKIQK